MQGLCIHVEINAPRYRAYLSVQVQNDEICSYLDHWQNGSLATLNV